MKKKNIHYVPKPKAIQGVHIYDPEHGGGRIRRNKHLPRSKYYDENSDKIGDRLNFHARIGLDLLQESPNPELRTNFEQDEQADKIMESCGKKMYFLQRNRDLQIQKQDSSEIPFEIAQQADDNEDEEDSILNGHDNILSRCSEPLFKVSQDLYQNDEGEAVFMKPEGSCTNEDPVPFNKVTVDQVHDLLAKRKHNEATKQQPGGNCFDIPTFILIDCRSPQEFQGGHIDGAVNISTPEQLSNFLLSSQERLESLMSQQAMLIFHCEFSERRAPFMYGLLREWDRRGNVE